MKNHDTCPECGSETEFVQFATGKETTVETDPEEVGCGLLELRSCDNCPAAVEIVLTAESYTYVEIDRNL